MEKRREEASEESQVAEDIEAVQYVGSLEESLAEEKEKAEGYLANWQRAQADFINFKRRTEQERAEVVKFANSAIIADLLPVLDDFDLALENAPEDSAGATWVDGIRLIQRKLRSVLEAQGLSQIEALGQDFDPHFHEAMMFADGDEGKVVEEVQKGYMLHERVLRPTKVKVGRGGENEPPAEEEGKQKHQ